MPTWGEILGELGQTRTENGAPDFDGVRRKYLAHLHELTGRDTILYATDWLGGNQPATSIVLEDILGLMETCKGLKGPDLDLIIHSPGGDPDATASLVNYLRQRYTNIRVFVPVAAMSAATMWALASDEICMGKHSQLGPIDPQLVSAQGQFPARAILAQFEQAKREIEDNPNVLAAWLPILQGYGPSLLQQCTRAEELAQRLVRLWLRTWMLSKRKDRSLAAARIARYFADADRHGSHGAGISREAARSKGVIVSDLEADPDLQDAVLSVHHATMHAFGATPAVKIVENHLGKAFVKTAQMGLPIGVMQGPPGMTLAPVERPPSSPV